MKPYNQTDSKKSQIRTMFDRIAGHYDLLNSIMSLGIDRYWRRRTIKALRPAAPKHILDVATGTGDLAVALTRLSPDVHITGVDLSPEMIAVGREKIARRGLQQRISLDVGDAEKLAFEDAAFDAATVAFGVRNFGDIPQGLHEMGRTLKKGGTIAVLEFSKPNNRLFGKLFRFYFHRIVPLIGGAISHDRAAYDYLPSSVDEFPSPERFMSILEQAGFENCRAIKLTFGVAYIYTATKR